MKPRPPNNKRGTVLKPDQAALVFETDGRMSIVLPDMPADAEIPSGWRLMLAIIDKCSDADWVGGRDRPDVH
jgi:hypothetical protein